MSWWDAAYRQGQVNWDPGPYDRHLERIVDEHAITPGRALDIGCGTGKAAIWLARRGFDVTGIDSAASAVDQARQAARRAGLRAEAPSSGSRPGRARFEVASFPVDVGPGRAVDIAEASLDLVVERATLQHIGGHGASSVPVAEIAALMKPGALFYSLMIAGEGIPRGWGMGRWNDTQIRRLMEPHFSVVRMEYTVFTPGEIGSVPAWLTLLRKPG